MLLGWEPPEATGTLSGAAALLGVLLISLVALDTLGIAAVCCEPALAGPVGGGVIGADSCLVICLAVTLTRLGTGYLLGIDPRCAYV